MPEDPSTLPAQPTELDARRELARAFRIESLLARPPGPIVYVARDLEDRLVMLRVVPSPPGGESAADRFHSTADAARQLDHPHILPVYGQGATEHFLWSATKYVDGRSLARILQTAGPIELPACLRILEQVASALDHAHRRGVAHGALTPDCIIVDANEWVLVGDFAMTGPVDAALDGPVPPAGEPAIGADQRALATIAQQSLAELPLHVSQALRRALSSRPGDQFPSVLDFVAALGGTRPDTRTAWFSGAPRKKGPGSPVVIVDADADPAATRPVGGRIAAGAGAVIALGASALWLGMSSAPAAPVSRQPVAPTPSPVSEAPAPWSAPRSASRDTLVPGPAARAPAHTTRPPVARRPVTPRPVERNAEPALLSINAIPWGSVYLDGQPVGNTPQVDLPVASGPHRLRVERDGFRPYERVIEVAPGQRLRITDIALVER